MLRNRQAGWCKQHKAKSRDDIVAIDCPIPGEASKKQKTIRDLIMEIKTTDKIPVQLIASVDKKWKGPGFTFSYHPARAEEAEVVIRGLYPRFAHYYGVENIKPFFTPSAIREGTAMKYDPVTHRVTSAADTQVSEIADADPDMAFSEITDENATVDFSDRAEEFVKERGDDDSISTFHKRAPPDEITAQKSKKKAKKSDPKDNDDSTAGESNTSSLSFTTKHTLDTRISSIESKFNSIQGDVKSGFENMFQAIAAIQASVSTNQAGNPVSPESGRHISGPQPMQVTDGGPASPPEDSQQPETSMEVSGVS
jgi:hypothetical protein